MVPELETFTCGHCGAPLSAPGEAAFVDCRHCGTSLRVVRNESAVYTEINERVAGLTNDVSKLRTGAELQEVETQWLLELQAFRSRSQLSPHLYRRTGKFMLWFLVLLGLALVVVMLLLTGRAGVMPVGSALLLSSGGVFLYWYHSRLADDYERAERAYHAKRAAAQRET